MRDYDDVVAGSSDDSRRKKKKSVAKARQTRKRNERAATYERASAYYRQRRIQIEIKAAVDESFQECLKIAHNANQALSVIAGYLGAIIDMLNEKKKAEVMDPTEEVELVAFHALTPFAVSQQQCVDMVNALVAAGVLRKSKMDRALIAARESRKKDT